MKNPKPKYYLTAFSALYLLLLGVMAYYFYNAYQLKTKEVISYVYNVIDNYEDSDSFKSLELKQENGLYASILDFIHGKKTVDEIKEDKKDFMKQSNDLLSHHIDSLFEKDNYEVAVRHVVKRVYSNKDQKELLTEPFTVLKTDKNISTSYRINSSKWEVKESSLQTYQREKEEEYQHHFTIFQEKYTDILNINSIVLLSLVPLLLVSVLICLFILLLYYITYKTIKQKEQEVINLHNMVDNVSHEFKLPIATLKYGCNNLSKEYQSPTIELLKRQIDRLERLQNTLSTNITEDTVSYTKEDFYNMFADLQDQFPSVVFHKEWSADLTLLFPKTPIETILLNLIENAVKYGGTEITCQLIQKNKKVVLTIKDNGIGIDSNQKQLIFKKFYRIMQDNIHTTKGLGIGLHQVQQVVNLYKGSIILESKVNKGTTFKITLPHA